MYEKLILPEKEENYSLWHAHILLVSVNLMDPKPDINLLSVCVHTDVCCCIHVLLKINILVYIITIFFLLLVHAGRYLHLKVKLLELEDIMLTTVAETAEVAVLKYFSKYLYLLLCLIHKRLRKISEEMSVSDCWMKAAGVLRLEQGSLQPSGYEGAGVTETGNRTKLTSLTGLIQLYCACSCYEVFFQDLFPASGCIFFSPAQCLFLSGPYLML